MHIILTVIPEKDFQKDKIQIYGHFNLGKKVFYSDVILYENPNPKKNPKKKIEKVIFGGLPGFFVYQNFAKITNLLEFPFIKEISKNC